MSRRTSRRQVRRGTVLLAGLVLTSTLPIAATATAAPVTTAPSPTAPSTPPVPLTLPAPTGHRRGGTVSLHLIDRSRPDPWVPAQPVRHLMVQIWYPAAAARGYPYAPWMTPGAVHAYEQAIHVPAGVLGWPTTRAHLGAPVSRREGARPVIVYSHGLGGERTEATALVEDLASHGYIVVTIDHVHDATAVELPDGQVETTALPELTEDNELQVTTKAIESRVADTRFVLDQLTAIGRGANPDAEHRPLPRGLRATLDLTRIGMLGHSDGGATTGAVMHVDSRVSACVDLDGTFWTPDAAAGSDRPMLLFGSEAHHRDNDPTWAAFWTSQRGPTLQLNLTGSAPSTFHALALMLPKAAPTLGIPPATVTRVVGTIDGERATAIVRAYVNAYFDRYLRHHPSRLLSGPSARYPEVRFTP